MVNLRNIHELHRYRNILTKIWLRTADGKKDSGILIKMMNKSQLCLKVLRSLKLYVNPLKGGGINYILPNLNTVSSRRFQINFIFSALVEKNEELSFFL